MDIKEYNTQKDQYFQDFLSKNELSNEFQIQLNRDKKLNEEFEFENMLRAALMLQYKNKLIDMTTEIRKENQPKTLVKSSRTNIFKWSSIAASLGILIAAFVFMNNEVLVSDDIYLASLENYQNTTISKYALRSATKTEGFNDSLKTAIISMKNKDYSKSSVILSELSNIHSQNEDVKMQQAILAFYESDYTKLDQLVLDLTKSNNKDIREEAEMLLVQTKLKENKIKEAKIALNQITTTRNHRYYGDAKEYLKKI